MLKIWIEWIKVFIKTSWWKMMTVLGIVVENTVGKFLEEDSLDLLIIVLVVIMWVKLTINIIPHYLTTIT